MVYTQVSFIRKRQLSKMIRGRQNVFLPDLNHIFAKKTKNVSLLRSLLTLNVTKLQDKQSGRIWWEGLKTMSKENIKALLQETDFFGGLSTAILDTLIDLAKVVVLRTGETLFEEGDTLTSIYLLTEGRVQCFSADGNGKKFVFMFSKPGDMLGEISYLDGGPCAWSAVAEEECCLLMFRRADLITVFGQQDGLPCEEVRAKILMRLVGMVRQISTSAKNLALLDVYGRIRILFNDSLVEKDGLLSLDKPLTQQRIADQIGSSREMVARILKELLSGHYIRMENRRIVLLKMLPEHF